MDLLIQMMRKKLFKKLNWLTNNKINNQNQKKRKLMRNNKKIKLKIESKVMVKKNK